jgi:PncC family amidohydrolase
VGRGGASPGAGDELIETARELGLHAGGTAAAQWPGVPAEVRLGALLGGDPRLTVAAAESCSGGEVAHRVTAVPGSSAYFLGSIVAYANAAKTALLGVPQAVLDSVGAVSEACARAMAEGARGVFGADLAVATTGIAGPTGGTARKPVGLVYLAIARPDRTDCEEHRFAGDRLAVIDAAATRALELLVEAARSIVSQPAPPSGAA